MRTFVNTTVYNALPNDLQNVIGETYVVSGHGDRDYSNFVTTDKLYLLSAKEVWGSGSFSADSSTRQLDYYSSIGVNSTNYGGAIKYNSSKSAVGWWLRSGLIIIINIFILYIPLVIYVIIMLVMVML